MTLCRRHSCGLVHLHWSTNVPANKRTSVQIYYSLFVLLCKASTGTLHSRPYHGNGFGVTLCHITKYDSLPGLVPNVAQTGESIRHT